MKTIGKDPDPSGSALPVTRDDSRDVLPVTRDESRDALPVTRDEPHDALPVTRYESAGVIKSHKDLDVWQVSMDFVIELYRMTEQFPASEKFGLIMQLRRAGVSISSNIAEGAARAHPKEFVQFLYVSLGSVSEVETQLEIAFRLQYIESIALQKNTLDRIRRMLIGLIKSVTRNA